MHWVSIQQLDCMQLYYIRYNIIRNGSPLQVLHCYNPVTCLVQLGESFFDDGDTRLAHRWLRTQWVGGCVYVARKENSKCFNTYGAQCILVYLDGKDSKQAHTEGL